MRTVCTYLVIFSAIQLQAAAGDEIVRTIPHDHVVAKRSLQNLMDLLRVDRWLQTDEADSQVDDVPATETTSTGTHSNSVASAHASTTEVNDESAGEPHQKVKRSIEPLLTVDRLLHIPQRKLEETLKTLPGGKFLVPTHTAPKHHHLNVGQNHFFAPAGLQPPVSHSNLFSSSQADQATQERPITAIFLTPLAIRPTSNVLQPVQEIGIVTMDNMTFFPTTDGSENSTENTTVAETRPAVDTSNSTNLMPVSEALTSSETTTLSANSLDQNSTSSTNADGPSATERNSTNSNDVSSEATTNIIARSENITEDVNETTPTIIMSIPRSLNLSSTADQFFHNMTNSSTSTNTTEADEARAELLSTDMPSTTDGTSVDGTHSSTTA